jgi:hypothetical protein
MGLIKDKRIAMYKGIKPFVVILLLLLYILGTVEIDTFHSALHANDNTVLHSAQNEKDFCHRTIYHQDKKNGCEHKTHFTDLKLCPLCQVTSHSDHFFFVRNHNENPIVNSNYLEAVLIDFETEIACFKSPRAPPVI